MVKTNLNDDFKEALTEIDERIKESKMKIELGEALNKLHETPEFVDVVLNSYFEQEAQRIFGVLVEPNHLKRDVMENLMDKLTAIRNMRQFFVTTLINAETAKESIIEEERYRKEFTAQNSIIENKE